MLTLFSSMLLSNISRVDICFVMNLYRTYVSCCQGSAQIASKPRSVKTITSAQLAGRIFRAGDRFGMIRTLMSSYLAFTEMSALTSKRFAIACLLCTEAWSCLFHLSTSLSIALSLYCLYFVVILSSILTILMMMMLIMMCTKKKEQDALNEAEILAQFRKQHEDRIKEQRKMAQQLRGKTNKAAPRKRTRERHEEEENPSDKKEKRKYTKRSQFWKKGSNDRVDDPNGAVSRETAHVYSKHTQVKRDDGTKALQVDANARQVNAYLHDFSNAKNHDIAATSYASRKPEAVYGVKMPFLIPAERQELADCNSTLRRPRQRSSLWRPIDAPIQIVLIPSSSMAPYIRSTIANDPINNPVENIFPKYISCPNNMNVRHLRTLLGEKVRRQLGLSHEMARKSTEDDMGRVDNLHVYPLLKFPEKSPGRKGHQVFYKDVNDFHQSVIPHDDDLIVDLHATTWREGPELVLTYTITGRAWSIICDKRGWRTSKHF